MSRSIKISESKFACLPVDISEEDDRKKNKNDSKKSKNDKAGKKQKEKEKKQALRKERNELRSLAFGSAPAAKTLINISPKNISSNDGKENEKTEEAIPSDTESSNDKKIEKQNLNDSFADLSLKNRKNLPPSTPPSSQTSIDSLALAESIAREREVLILKLKSENSEIKLKMQDLEMELHNVKLRNSLLCQAMNLGEMKDKKELLVENCRLSTLNGELTSCIANLNAEIERQKSLVSLSGSIDTTESKSKKVN
ncbi:DgyrCDS12384 [Dimorphilus gyrociliatus]|uniref:DgyrCDS12384 n=1 Tax=Dimorphilus gyrociliatus TaxID=2664684 RepID=A0A7I8W799_9ANNE|nr:DgyrCDS12384 [Dimorphilus gyrociliatus]